MLLLRGFRLFGPKVPSDDSASFSMPWNVSTEYGLNLSVHHNWRFGDLTGRRQNLTDTITTSSYLMAQKCRQRAPASEFLSFDTEYLIADNRDLLADTLNTDPRLSHWPVVAAWWKERIKYVGPYGEHTTVVFDRPPWIRDWKEYSQHGLALILDACVYFFPSTNFGAHRSRRCTTHMCACSDANKPDCASAQESAVG